MPAAAVPPNESERLASLQRYGILDTPPERAYDLITALAARMFDVPMALISLVDHHRQWFKSHYGWEITETGREASICAHAIQLSEPLVVGDTLLDERFSDNLWVTGEPHIRFYAGAQLRTPDGHHLGTLCILDRKARNLTQEDCTSLQNLADLVIEHLELKGSNGALGRTVNTIHKHQEALVELTNNHVLNKGDAKAAFREITEVTARTLEVERAGVWWCVTEVAKIRCRDLYEWSRDHHSRGFEFQAKNYPAYFSAIEAERIIAAHDARTDPRTREFTAGYLYPFGITSMLTAPIRLRGRTVGVVCFEHVGTCRQWSPEEQQFAVSTADLVSLVMKGFENRPVEESALKAKRPLYDMLENIQLVAVLLDVKGNVTFCNEYLLKLTGYPKADVVGRNWFDNFIPQEQRKGATASYLNKILQGVIAPHDETDMVTRGGDRRLIFWNNTVLRSHQGTILGVARIGIDVTEQRQAEETLKSSEARNRLLLDSIPDVMFRVSPLGNTLEYRPAKDFDPFGVTGNLNGKNVFEWMPADLGQHVMHQVESTLQTGEAQSLEFQTAITDRFHDFEARFVPSRENEVLVIVRDIAERKRIENELREARNELEIRVQERTSELETINLVLRDEISERKQIEEALRKSEERYRHLFDYAPIGIYRSTPEGRILMANPALVRMLGYASLEELSELNLNNQDDFSADYSRNEFIEMSERESELGGLESVWRRRNGSIMFVREYIKVVRSAEGTVSYYEGTVEDITERKRAEAELRDSQERYRILFESNPFPVWVWDLKTFGFLAVNEAAIRHYGFSREEFLAMTVKDIRPAEDVPRLLEVFSNPQLELKRTALWRHRKKDGSVIDVETTSLAILFGGRKARCAIVHDITKRKRAEAALRQSEERYRDLYENANDLFYTHDLEGNFTSCNKVTEQVSGHTREAILTMNIAQVLAPEHLEMALKMVDGKLQDKTRTIYDLEFIAKDGQRIPVEINSRLIFEDGAAVGIQGIARDITERKRIQEMMKLAHDSALESARLKSQFLANMSHEIRTPLNGVLGMTRLLLDTELTAKQRDFVDTIYHSGDSLLTIINDILDLSKIEAGKIAIESTDFKLHPLIEQVFKVLTERAQSKRLHLSFQIDRAVPLGVQGDPVRLRQILLNLVGNAIKFTEKGNVTLSVTSFGGPETPAAVRFEITDTGIGIPTVSRQVLFQPFAQADGSTTRKYGGTGLGLAICKQLVELMGGQIDFKSIPGQGSTFWFTLPLLTRQPWVETVLPDHSGGELAGSSPSAGIRVLVVEDNEANQWVIRFMLEKLGCRVDTEGNGLKALNALSQSSYDLIFMDCQMPLMDGYEATAVIREQEAPTSSHIPIIALTANAMQGDRERCLQAGMDDYLSKPYKPEDVLKVLARWVPQSVAVFPDEEVPESLPTDH